MARMRFSAASSSAGDTRSILFSRILPPVTARSRRGHGTVTARSRRGHSAVTVRCFRRRCAVEAGPPGPSDAPRRKRPFAVVVTLRSYSGLIAATGRDLSVNRGAADHQGPSPSGFDCAGVWVFARARAARAQVCVCARAFACVKPMFLCYSLHGHLCVCESR